MKLHDITMQVLVKKKQNLVKCNQLSLQNTPDCKFSKVKGSFNRCVCVGVRFVCCLVKAYVVSRVLAEEQEQAHFTDVLRLSLYM